MTSKNLSYKAIYALGAMLLSYIICFRIIQCLDPGLAYTFDSFFYLERFRAVKLGTMLHFSNDWFFSYLFGSLARLSNMKLENYYRGIFLLHYATSIVVLAYVLDLLKVPRYMGPLLLCLYSSSNVFFVGSNIHIRQFIGLVWGAAGIIFLQRRSHDHRWINGVIGGVLVSASILIHTLCLLLFGCFMLFRRKIFATPTLISFIGFLVISLSLLSFGGWQFGHFSLPSVPTLQNNYFLSILPHSVGRELFAYRVSILLVLVFSVLSRTSQTVVIAILSAIFLFPPFEFSSDIAARLIWLAPMFLVFSIAWSFKYHSTLSRLLTSSTLVFTVIASVLCRDTLKFAEDFPYKTVELYSEQIKDWIPRGSQIIAEHGINFFLTYTLGIDATSKLTPLGFKRSLVLASKTYSYKEQCSKLSDIDSIEKSTCLQMDESWVLIKAFDIETK